ncbi:hypothetical protein [Noviherbaspirillum autotrophicum]|uniref:Uncharacterized protein n=1 Tax=Noviherbaspirillum autotrophicum TaxID=709839 RepID=A0A0C1Y8F5_9BURK|nr:hypothetical protein [Noviherbaspirillum autotrophicum]KIF83213.1 hypothetical protein TSA66_24065 [Noviherbaspirillum autotrophicum]
MNKQPDDKKQNLLATFGKAYSGPLTHVALSAVSAWMIVTGIKGLLGFTVNRQTALADLAGIALVIGLLRWSRLRQGSK